MFCVTDLLEAFLHLGHDALCSFVQGHFSFVVFDSSKRRFFAARDASGTEPLFINTDDDGTTSFTNAPTSGLANGCQTWQEVF